ncbi:phosphoadenosine phosphosulfate reductase [Cokeromyces recurvatus]|uniref:phosphoadenosine phosphosulfate reductase n=1 Tax=Cokeromyces recurvatus TaxID=90255 RepID=UPI00221EA11C|nr:phosphoadenosine phosphosulfate reductase [Cokeromyces recurvatus]KAI7907119.1 phosphoadenosine phosphosulfate reductase [Cokeromyces recurvatus]
MPVSTTQQYNSDLTFNDKEYLEKVNKYLSELEPKEILEWAIDHLPTLYQTTAFGLSGLVALDMINKISIDRGKSHLVPLIFLDTLYHFDETLELAKRCEQTYGVSLKVYKPMEAETKEEFEHQYGSQLWETDEDAYDYLVKVEPAHRAYRELKVKSIITGRRRSQKGERSEIPVIEVDSTGLIKLNPLAFWDFQRVWTYIRANEVPYNLLIDQGYRSIGDWHSTRKPNSSSHDDERSGRWSGKGKSECGLHKDYFQMRAAFLASKKKREQQKKLVHELSDSLSNVAISS